MPTFAEYLEKWLKQSTAQGLTNPLVKMPVKRFRFSDTGHSLQVEGPPGTGKSRQLLFEFRQ
jgi:hypothetical protein